MNEVLNVYVDGYGDYSIKKGSNLLQLSKEINGKSYKKYLGARINNEVYNLNKYVKPDMKIKFLDVKDNDGDRIYTKTISAVFIMACKELYGDIDVSIENFLGPGLYAEFEHNRNISFSKVKEIENKMREIIEKDSKIERIECLKEEAIRLFNEVGYEDKVRLLKSIDNEKASVYKINDHVDSFHGYLAPSTGFVKDFKLKYYYPGVIILFPRRNNGYDMNNFIEQKKLAKIFKESNDWLEIMDLAYIGSLNEKVNRGEVGEVVRVSEALHEKKIGFIADEICKDKDINIILIAGPSSSGKTTFAQRLAIQLKVNGKRPISISVDDYFVDRENTPLNEDGTPDFEALEAIDLDAFNIDLLSLLEGNEVELPKFNFITGKRERSGKIIKVDQDHPIIIEGIHGLNPKLTEMIPEKNKYKIYISALTQLNIDAHNRISTSDTRLIRRIVRDNQYRGSDSIRTFELWGGVRAGEEKHIFPYQEEADIMFNSSLVYELGVLKKYVIPLLSKIDSSSIYYGEAKKLLRFLEYFREIDLEEAIPPNSILREFIGGTYFNIH
ncbi:nucleoside kinase [Tissierella sp. Yu-01]|uniref:nucleoside kinase n=1 Tax=Tissierella sp. Yu-01 TaxID=3035694 RepID=UPI00240E0D89|nr:nucleoside kinase [Tissierella sp. Yu-01]WFA09399.1 nucleoside kinase [Tissierella sp. Yu-01]